MGLGIDIVDITRISNEENFANFILSDKEKEIYLLKGLKK